MKDPNKAYIQGALIGLLIGVAAGIWAGLAIAGQRAAEATVTERHVTVYDTVSVIKPVPRDSVVIRYETARLPLAADSTDTAAVAVPMERVEYTDTAYRAVIEGTAPGS